LIDVFCSIISLFRGAVDVDTFCGAAFVDLRKGIGVDVGGEMRMRWWFEIKKGQPRHEIRVCFYFAESHDRTSARLRLKKAPRVDGTQ
jgi:hypothetical protein